MPRFRVFLGLAVPLFLMALPATAAGEEAQPCGPTTVAALGPATIQDALFAPGPAPSSVDGPTAQAECTADCHDGSTVTCSGSSCSAVDSDCANGERGYCTGTDTGTKYCPVCDDDTCSATATCSDGSTVSCSGTSGDCFGVDGCYAYCDGQKHWCPNPTEPCPI